MYITAVRVIVIDILHYIAFWLILLVHVHRVTHIHLNEDLLYLEPWFGHYQMTSITKIKTYVSIYMLLVISSWQYMSHISYILNLDVFSVNIILNKMYSTCVITMTITPGDKYKQNKILILVMKYLETFPQPVFISFFEFYLFLRCGWGSALINVTLSTCIILHEIILFTLFLNIILILNSRNIRNLLVQGPHSFSIFELKTFLKTFFKTFFTTLTTYCKKIAIFLRKLKASLMFIMQAI